MSEQDGLTRAEALDSLRGLAGTLACNTAGVERLLERIAGQSEAETLRDALVELGAAALLSELDRDHGDDSVCSCLRDVC